MSTGLIDLSTVAAPAVVENLAVATIRDAMLADLVARDPAFTALTASDPAYKILEVAAYRETLIRARVNEACKAVMLPYASESDLDNLATFYGITRNGAESDTALRRRCQLALHAVNTAGSEGSYLFHARSAVYQASPEVAPETVADAAVDSPVPGTVRVSILGNTAEPANGVASAGLLAAVNTALSAKTARPLTDTVIVTQGVIEPYAITATLYFFSGPDRAVVMADALAAARAYAADNFRLGRAITLSGIFAALHRPGVSRVDLAAPTANLILDGTRAARCTAITLTDGGLA